jgi:hypothetical protein
LAGIHSFSEITFDVDGEKSPLDSYPISAADIPLIKGQLGYTISPI